MKMRNLQETGGLQSTQKRPQNPRKPQGSSQRQAGADRILCADSESLLHPDLLGLEGENVAGQDWLVACSDASGARELVRSVEAGSVVWVAGSDGMEAINLAAAFKMDRPDVAVHLVSFNGNGSLYSRAKAAGLDSVMDRPVFLAEYAAAKRRACGGAPLGAAAPKAPEVRENLPQTAGGPESGPAARDAFAGIRPGPLMPSGMPLLQADGSSGGERPIGAMAAAASPRGASSGEGAYVLTVVGAGGGTGKSSASVLCACHACRAGRRVLLLDADLQFGDLAFLMGCDAPLRSDDLLESPLRAETLLKASGMPAFLAAPLRLERSEFVAGRFDELMGLLRPRFDAIVINTGPSWSDLHVRLFSASSNVLFLLDQRPSSIRACRHGLELCASCGIASQPFLFAMNRCSRKALFTGSDASVALQGARVFEFLDGGVAVEEQLGCGDPMALFGSGNPFAQSIEAFMEEVLPAKDGVAGSLVLPEVRRKRWSFGKRRSR